MATLELQQQRGLEPTKTWQRPLPEEISKTAATAQTFYINLPKDHFIHEIIVRVTEAIADRSDEAVVDEIADLKVVGNGTKYLKDLTGAVIKEIQKMQAHRPATGIYHLYFSDPKIPETKPLPAWVFTSLQLIITDVAPDATKFHFINVTIVESAYRGEDLSDWKVLIEKYLIWKHFGTATGWQEYEHERAYKIYSYIYIMDDNATLSDTIFDKVKLVGRKPEGEVTILDEVFVSVQKAENNGRILTDLATGYMFIQWLTGFPSNEFTALKSYLNIKTAGTDAGLRVVERYVL